MRQFLALHRSHQVFAFWSLLAAITFFVKRVLADGSIVTISDTQNYNWQDACVKGAVWANERSIPRVIGCPANSGGNFLNSCFCRADLVPVAHSFLSSAVPTACSYSPVADLSSAVLLYDNYCSSFQAVITPTGFATAPLSTYSATPLAEAPTQTYTGGLYSPTPSPKPKSKLSKTGKILIGVFVAFIVLVILGGGGK